MNVESGKRSAITMHGLPTGLSSSRWVACLICLLTVFTAQGETLYVDDTLRVGVRPLPDSREAPINVVTTGMKLEIIDRRDGFLQIKTAEGIEGWIKDTYASKDKPAVIRLEILHKEHAELRKQFDKLETEAREASETNRVLVEDLKRVKQENINLHLQLVTEKEVDTVHTRGDSRVWLIIGAIFVAVLFFAAGAAWFRYTMSKRFGGLRF